MFVGRHCESTTLVNLLRPQGIDLSEPLVFGLAGGLSFIYWKTARMPVPFLGGRIKPDLLTTNLAGALGLRLSVHETSSARRAREHLLRELDAGHVVGLKLDRFFLDYSTDDFHFAAHYVACVGHEDDRFALVETEPLGLRWATGQSLAAARSARGPMSSPHRAFTVDRADHEQPDLGRIARTAIAGVAERLLHPPIANFGVKGMRKVAGLLPSWLDDLAEPADSLHEIATLMEDGGTGGGLFRTMWADFLTEAADLTGTPELRSTADAYRQVSEKWTGVAALLHEAGAATSRAPLEKAATVVREIAGDEERLMWRLSELCG